MTFKGTCPLLDNSDHMTFSIDFCFGTYVSRIRRVAGMGKCGGKPAADLPKCDRMITVRLFEYFTNY